MTMFEFPIELWGAAFRKVQDKDLVALSHTCALFRILAQAQLYNTIGLQYEELNYSHEGMMTWRLIRLFKRNPSLARLVRTLEFRNMVGSPWVKRSKTFPIIGELHLFYGLQTIVLVSIHLDSKTCSSLQALPCLKSVSLENCRIDRGVTENLVGTVPARTLDIEIVAPRSVNVLFPARFKSFSIGTYEHTKHPGDVVEEVLDYVASTGFTQSVTTLVFKAIIPATAIRFLETLSQLQHIYLPNLQSEGDLLSLLPSDALPFLETFSGPAQLCDVFLRGRPVHTVEMFMPTDMPQDILRVLRLSSVGVRDLHMIFNTNWGFPAPGMGLLLQHAPETIQHLAWNSTPKPMLQEIPVRSNPGFTYINPSRWSPVGKAGVLSCLPFLKRFPSLHTLRGRVIDPLEGILGPGPYHDPERNERDIRLDGQDELVRACAEASASLQLFIFKGRERDGKWVKWDDGRWEYYTVE